MDRSLSLIAALWLLLLGGEASAQETFVPSTVSDEAAAIIRTIEPGELVLPEERAETTPEQWKADWEAFEEQALPESEEALERYPATIETVEMAGHQHLLITPDSYDPENERRLIVYVHGGAHTFFSPESTLGSSLPAAHFARTKVLAVRYPLAWQAPHPASRDLVVAVYEQLLLDHAPRRIAMYGDSAGGAAVMSAVLKMRDDGLQLPAVLGLISPWADISDTGDSLTVLRGADPLLPDYEATLKASAEVYAAGAELTDPSISPLYANYTKGFPPAFISTGTRDLFLSHCARLQRKLLDAGIDNQLVVYEGMWHVFQTFRIPEGEAAWRDMIAFFERHWAR